MKNPDAERNNPCLRESNLSYKCLDKNNYDYEKCTEYFENYNTCKKFWGQVYNDRRSKGLHPYMPHVEDRAKIKEEYFNTVYANTSKNS